MEGPAWVALEPGQDLGMLVGGVVVEDDLDHLAGRNLAFDRIEKTNEFLMAVLLHATADYRAVENVDRMISCASSPVNVAL